MSTLGVNKIIREFGRSGEMICLTRKVHKNKHVAATATSLLRLTGSGDTAQ